MLFVLALALGNAYLMGFHGSAAVVSTVISSRALSPRRALLLTAVAALVGPLVFGSAVAGTIGALAHPAAWSLEVLVCGLLAAVSWTLLTWWLGLPCSASQALIGGLLGALTVATGPEAVQRAGVIKIFVGLFISPPVGFIAGLLLMRLMLWLAQFLTPRANVMFKYAQLLTSFGLALAVSSNDVQKILGLLLIAFHLTSATPLPLWATLLGGGAFALGLVSGGYRLIRTLGGRLYKIRPIHGFVAQGAAALLILSAGQTGLPVSSTQVLSTAIVGVGSAERLSKVRWRVAAEMMTAWFLTIPVTAALAGAGLWVWKG